MKKLTLVAVLAFALILSSMTVFADGSQSILSNVTGLSDDQIAELRTQRIGYGQLIPASILAKRLNMNIEDVIALRQSGKTYYQIATDKGIKAEDYKNDLLESKNVYVDEMVKAGTITEDQGKLIKDRFKANIESCDGQTPGAGRANGSFRMGFGNGMGKSGNGGGMGRGFGRMSNGAGFRGNVQ